MTLLGRSPRPLMVAILQVAIAAGYSEVRIIDDFEGSSNTTWTSQARSKIDTRSQESGKDSSTGLKWTFLPDGVNRYGNQVAASFAPVDPSPFKALRFDFKINGPNVGRIGCQLYSSSGNKVFDIGDINQFVGEEEWSEVVLALPAGITAPIDGLRLFYDGIAYKDSAGLICQADNFRLDSDDSVAPPVAPPLDNPGVAFSSLSADEQASLRRATAPKPLAERVNPYSTPMYYPMWGGSSPDGTQRSDLQEALIREFAELGMSKIHFYAYPDGVGATNPEGIKYSVSPANKLGIEELVRICKQYGVKIGLRVDLPYVRVPEWDRPGLDPAVSYWLCNPRNPDNQLAQYAGWLKEMVTLLQGNLEYIVIGDEVSDYDLDRKTFIDGVAWSGTYEGGVLPSASAPAWSIYANSGMWSGSGSNGIYTQRTMVNSAGAWQVSTGFDNPLGTRRTVEAKLRLGINGSYPSAGDGVVDLLLFGGSRYIELRIDTNSISMKGTTTSSAGVDMLSSFNTIRLTYDSALSTDAWKLYLNSNATPIITSGSDPGAALGSPFHAVVFGDPSTGGIGGESQWDYISWTDAGAFDPVSMAWTKEDQLAVLKECSEAIREVDRDVLVSGFAASSGKIDDVITLVEMGYGDFANAVAINHYDYTVVPEFLRKLKEAGGKDFPLLSNGVGYISSDTPLRNPPQDPYSRYNDEDQASMIARTMYSWWDNGAQVAPYYVCLRSMDYKGNVQVMWYGFFGFMDFVVDGKENASFRRYPGWYAYRTVANVFDDRPSFQDAAFQVTASKPEKLYLKAFEREGKDLTLMIWREDRRQVPVDITIESGSYKYPVQIDLMDQDKLTDVAYEAPGGRMTLKNVPTGFRPTIVRLFHEDAANAPPETEVPHVVNWNGTFEGDVFPSASTPAWSIYANSGSWTANNNIPGIFTQDTFVGSAGAWQVSTGFNDPLSTKRTVEAKLKVGSNANYPNAAGGAVTLLVFGGNRYMVFYIGTNSISMAGTSTASASVDMLSNFNTLRVTHDSTRSTDAWKLYLNSNATPIISSGSDPGVWQGSPYYAVVFGDPTTGGIGGESQWDYISWTDAGAFAPSPAPSSYAAWAQGAPLDATNQLLYAIGGASSPAATDWVAPVTSISSGMLSTAAIVRTNDPSLAVYGQSSLDLSTGAWMTNDVSMNPSVDQAGVPAGMQRQIFSTPRTPDETKKFLRLQMTLQP